jgi:hypothetical protein
MVHYYTIIIPAKKVEQAHLNLLRVKSVEGNVETLTPRKRTLVSTFVCSYSASERGWDVCCRSLAGRRLVDSTTLIKE